ncbi:AhpC/TSA family protein [Bacteriovoracaceae bacterium]|nr:AhpC/TSA family protein [Bacteriovoracaceae bacterium]
MIRILCLSILLFPIFSASKTLEQKLIDKANSFKSGDPKVTKIMNHELERIKKLNLTNSMLKKGSNTPTFDLMAFREKKLPFYDLLKKGPVVINFFRGGWCPYCKIELSEYQNLLGKIKKSGAQFISISPDTLTENAKTKRNLKLTYPIYTDKNNEIAKSFGLVFSLSEEILEVYKKFGINLELSQGNKSNQLPMPAVYIINQKGKVIYAWADPDYKKRADPLEIPKVLNR